MTIKGINANLISLKKLSNRVLLPKLGDKKFTDPNADTIEGFIQVGDVFELEHSAAYVVEVLATSLPRKWFMGTYKTEDKKLKIIGYTQFQRIVSDKRAIRIK